MASVSISSGDPPAIIDLGIQGLWVPLHSHICYPFATDREFADAVGFVEAGLRATDHCVVFGDDRYYPAVHQILQERGVGPDDLVVKGRLTWVAGDASSGPVLGRLVRAFQGLIDGGASLIRCFCIGAWRRENWPKDHEMLRLEAESNAVAQDFPSVVVCLQDLRTLPGLVLRHGVLSSHPLILADGVVMNPLFEAEDRFLRKKIGEMLDQNALVEAKQRESYQRFQRAFEHAAIGMALKDLDGFYLEVNEALCTITGYTKQELTTMNFREITHPSDLPRNLELLHQLIAGKISSFLIEKRYIKKDGQTAWVRNSVSLLRDEKGAPANIVYLCDDVTAHRGAEAALRQKEEQLRQATKMEALGQLAGGLAHDFNNLLTVINGYSDMLLDEEYTDRVQQIRNAGERAASLTRQLLAFSRRQILQPKVLDLNTLIAETATMLRRLIGENINLVTTFEASTSRIKADPAQIQQVIMNLAINARDAMPEGGTLGIRTANMDGEGLPKSMDQRRSYVMVNVSDTGIGMDADTRSHIFEPFFTTKGLGRGTGLGLSLVYGIVEQSGGSIEVESEPGRGTTFTLYLPVVEESAESSGLQPRATVALRSATILLVEDEEPVRQLASQMLKTAGYTVLQAPGGETALRLSEEYAGQIDLLLTDVVMPGISGPEVFRQMSRRHSGIKVLFMSGYTGEAVFRYGALEGSTIIEKPFTKVELVRKVQEALGGSAGGT